MRGTSRTGKSVSRAWGFLSRNPNEYACIVLKSLFCTISWYLFLSVQLSVQNFPTESFIAATADLSASSGMFQYPDYFVTCHDRALRVYRTRSRYPDECVTVPN